MDGFEQACTVQIYSSMEDAQRHTHDHGVRSAAYLEAAVRSMTGPRGPITKDHAMILEHVRSRPRTWRVLDIGAGTGVLKDEAQHEGLAFVEWREWDTREMVSATGRGTNLWPDPVMDIVIVNNALHVFSDPWSLLTRIDALSPSLVLLGDVPIWTHPTGVIIRSTGEEALPMWIFNDRQLADSCHRFGTVRTCWRSENTLPIRGVHRMGYHYEQAGR